MSARGASLRGSSRRTRHVLLRFALLLGAYLAWGALAWMFVSVASGSSTIVSSGTGRPTTTTTTTSTLYQSQPGVVRLLLVVLAGALVVSTASVVWRVVRRSARLGVTGLVVAGLVGACALLGMLTVGPFIAPFAALMVLLALPIAPESKQSSDAAPGWYLDPTTSEAWRFWDGRAWTDDTAPITAAR